MTCLSHFIPHLCFSHLHSPHTLPLHHGDLSPSRCPSSPGPDFTCWKGAHPIEEVCGARTTFLSSVSRGSVFSRLGCCPFTPFGVRTWRGGQKGWTGPRPTVKISEESKLGLESSLAMSGWVALGSHCHIHSVDTPLGKCLSPFLSHGPCPDHVTAHPCPEGCL